jgi:DNA-binding transcriptional LysR family regulator
MREPHLPELRQLKQFIAVAEELHFGRAAQRLNMTQPPLSQSVQNLEATLGVALFVRTTRQIALTEAGQALLPEARRILAQAENLAPMLQEVVAGTAGTLRLAFISIADYSILPRTLKAYREAFPGIRIELHEATTDRQLSMLQEGEIDAGLLIPPVPAHLQSMISYQTVRTEPLILAAPDSMTLPAGGVSLQDIAGAPLILFPRKIAAALHDTILSFYREHGLTPVIAQEAIQMQTIIGLVAAGMGVALVPQAVANLQRPGVVYHRLRIAAPLVETGVAWRKDMPAPALQHFLPFLLSSSC